LVGDLGTIPICVLGLLLRDFIETTFRTLALTAVMLIVFGLILGWAAARQPKPARLRSWVLETFCWAWPRPWR
jgi:undecaprenyl-diphosphatase